MSIIIPDIETFNRIKNKELEAYKLIGDIYCPYLKKNVSFNRKGVEHITMKEWNKTRPITDQYLRIKFLKIAPQVLTNSGTLQDFEQKRSFERVRINARWEYQALDTKYYGFLAIIKNIRIKVIVKEINENQPFFWSIIPFWKQKNNPFSQSLEKVFCEGNLENE